MMVLDKKKPATVATVRALEVIKCDECPAGTFEVNDNAGLRALQAARLSRRFAMSAPLALLIAELAYGDGGAR
jgi:hypothetical protein